MGLNQKRQPGVLDQLGMSIDDICSGIFATGTTGSGKTSVLKLLLRAILNYGVGCVWCCCKADEADNAESVIRASAMKDRLIRLIPGQFGFNFASFELTREGGSPETLARLFERLNRMLNRSKQGASSDSFWENLFQDFILAAITVAWLAHRDDVNVEHIQQIIVTSPQSMEHARSDAFQQSVCWLTLLEAQKKLKDVSERRALSNATEFILKKQTTIGEAARGAAIQQCTSVLSPFLRSPFYETVCASTSQFTPEMPLDQVCVVLDAPVLIWGDGGRLFQNLIVMMVMEAALRQTNPENYVAIIRDEYQLLVADEQFDMMVQSVARSHKLACISATQNLPLLTATLGGDFVAETHMKALLANYVTKFVLANICDTTNRFFSELFGQHKDQFTSLSENQQMEPKDGIESIFGARRFNFSTSEQLNYRVPPDRFLELRRGGVANDCLIDGYMMQGGRIFENGQAFKRVTFSQR